MKDKYLTGVGIFRIEEEIFGYKLTAASGMRILLAIACFTLFRFLPIPGLEVPGRIVLGIVLGSMLLWTIKEIPQAFTAILGGIVLPIIYGVSSYGYVVQSLGTTPFLMLMSLLIFATGMSNTKMAERISYFMIEKLGTSPFALVAALFITEVILSVFIANMPALLVVAAVAAGILKELGEVPGKSKFGAAVMISITLGSLVGGTALVSSSGANPTVIAVLEAATNGEYTITYNQWASIGVPFCIVMTLISLVVLKFMFKLSTKSSNTSLSMEDIRRKKEALGPMTNPEKRFFLALFVLTLLFLTGSKLGLSTPLVAIIGFLIVCCPGIGCVNLNQAFARTPWNVILMAIGTTIMVGPITETGLSAWLVDLLMGWTTDFSVGVIVLIGALAAVLLHYICTSSTASILLPAGVALAATVGFNPVYIIMPLALGGAYTVLMPFAPDTMLTYDYGYWKYSEMAKFGLVVGIFWAVVVTAVTMIVLPLTGVPMMI